MNYKTLYYIALSLIKGLKTDLVNRLNKCTECDYTLSYIDNAICKLEELENDR